MKLLLKILFALFIIGISTGFIMQYLGNPKHQLIIGLSILFLSFVLMPLFIFYRFRKGKYKKYVLNKDSNLFGFKQEAKKDKTLKDKG